MTSVQLKRYATSEADIESAIEIKDTPPSAPQGSQVRVQIKLRPINPSDALSVLGIYPGFQPKSFPATPGLECYGVIDELGPQVPKDVPHLKVGQRVVPMLHSGGSWQTHVNVDCNNVFPVPDKVTDEAAAQIFVNPLTVIGMVSDLQIPAQSWLLQNAAGSSLGRQVIAYANKCAKLRTVNLIRRNDPEQIADLKKLGADAVVVTDGLSPPEIARKIMEATNNEQPKGAIDAICGTISFAMTSVLAENSKYFMYGLMSGGNSAEISVVDMMFRNITVTGWWLNNLVKRSSPTELSNLIKEAFRLFEIGVFDNNVGQRFALRDVTKALIKQNQAARGGKLFLESYL